MAVETDVSELRERQKKKARRSLLIKFFAVLIVALLVLIAVFSKDMWYPYLDGILTKIPDAVKKEDDGSAALAQGKFPIAIEGGSDYQIKPMDDSFALIDDSHFRVYGTDGTMILEKQHAFSNPILTTSGKKALIYDLGGNSFSLESKHKTLYEKTTSQPILMADISSDVAAVVTKSDKYLAQLDVYSSEGNNIFTYKSYDSRIVDVTFNSDSSGCVITTLSASGGIVRSGLICLDFSITDMKWRSQEVDTLAVATQFDDEGNIVIIGDDRCVYFDPVGNIIEEHEYNDELVDYSASKKLTAVLLKSNALRKYSLLLVNSTRCTEAVNVDLPESASHIFVNGDMVYIMTGKGICTYNNYGQEIDNEKLSDAYEDFCKIGGYVFLLGYDEINRINFSG
ncbi:MAG: hypothetical protein II773_05185 [Oscillospiraceae bacterium]|nr:hypothetical protein [Oscillospiraceae bacterium]